MMRGFYGYGGYGFLGTIASALFWIVIILFIIALIRYLTGGHPDYYGRTVEPPVPKGEPPLEILKRRYAAGEINKKQFEEMKRDLR